MKEIRKGTIANPGIIIVQNNKYALIANINQLTISNMLDANSLMIDKISASIWD